MTLEVTDQEAAGLTLAQREGPLSLLVIAQADVLENATQDQRKGEKWDDPDVEMKNPITQEKTEKVFVAARNLHQGTPMELFYSMFKLKEIPAWMKPERAVSQKNFNELKKLMGTHVLVKAMKIDEPLSLDYLKDASGGRPKTETLHIIDGMRWQETFKKDGDGFLQPVKSPVSAPATK